ncbi:sensor histidine kinase [Actinomadura sp. WMMB 499]|uniref:sensor histidine kinase n=1 Tax=Actinomadura sp. WMMB 499 TaxID=1219491 RepID=UPI0012454B66|nr:histidine kinase [Actinomadura sp. WMMB 499]QFG21889.1 hypothetical protein F7P10_12885 [Actinomadura sp. WMMB 499]
MVMKAPADARAVPVLAEPRAAEAEPSALDRVRRAAAARERDRIARELHDVVTHHMSVIAVQATAALVDGTALPDAARRTLETVRDTAREALSETRIVVGRLRRDDETAGLGRLDDLVRAARRGGLPVSTVVTGTPRPLDPRTSLAAYRIVQESLGNAARYAPGARVIVEIRYGPGTLALSITDDGALAAPAAPRGGGAPAAPRGGGAPAATRGGGNGLVGMCERVTMLGGAIEAGPRGGGWSIVVHLPYGPHDAS